MAHSGDIIFARTFKEKSLAREWNLNKTELLYELTFLRLFIQWEKFLEQTFFRYLCGYSSSKGQQTMVRGFYYKTVLEAQAAVLGGQDYVMWYNPVRVVARATKFLSISTHQTVLSSNIARLEGMAAIRHRIVHEQEDAKNKFDQATNMFVGKRYKGSRPGRFLRDKVAIGPVTQRWLDLFATELLGLATQIM
jgi:hypothetical protein